ncbi:hypothetical protein HG530_013788 [Fusarium avenaceum]|nr:hypothetical protein HG530_013788 [Fusarium avenaceum]
MRLDKLCPTNRHTTTAGLSQAPVKYQNLGGPRSSLVAERGLDNWTEFLWRPRSSRLQLHRVVDSIGHPVLNNLVERNDQPPGHIGGGDTKHARTGVDNGESPGASVAVGLLVGSDERLALIVLYEIGGDVGILIVEGATVNEEVEDGRKDDKSLVRNTLLIKKVHQACHPPIVVANSVQVLVEVVVLAVHASVRHVIVVRVALWKAPGVVSGTSKVSQPHALVVVGGVVYEVLENIGLVKSPISFELLLGDDVLKAQFSVELLLTIILLNFGFEESGLPLQIAVIHVGGGGVLLDLVHHAENLGNARLVAVAVGFGKLLDGHGIGTAVIGAVALGRHGSSGVGGRDIDTTKALFRLVDPCVVRLCPFVGLLLFLVALVEVHDQAMGVRALLERPEILTKTLHQDEDDVLDLDVAISKRLLEGRQDVVVEVGDLQRVVHGVVVGILLRKSYLRALVVGD